MTVTLHRFGALADGSPVTEARIELPSGLAASILDYGAILRDLRVPAKGGALQRVVLGYRDIAAYAADPFYLGAIVGRYANRIAGGRFALDGKIYQLRLNERGRTHLHGGERGFSKRMWRILMHDEDSVTLALTSPAGEEAYPGWLEAKCIYRLKPPGTLAIELLAMGRFSPTIVNLVHHSYFTLTRDRSIRDHRLRINAAAYTPTDMDLIPTGEIRSVGGTLYDFRAPRPIAPEGERPDFIYDINFVLDREVPRPVLRKSADRLHAAPGSESFEWDLTARVPRHAATLEAPGAALRLDLHTTEPGLQFYDGAHLGAGPPGLDGRALFPHAGLCLEPGLFPDSPNHANFPSAVLRPFELYVQRTEYRFARA